MCVCVFGKNVLKLGQSQIVSCSDLFSFSQCGVMAGVCYLLVTMMRMMMVVHQEVDMSVTAVDLPCHTDADILVTG